MRIIGAALIVAMAGCGSTEPGPSESRIVFRGFAPDAINLFSIASDGRDLKQLTDDAFVESDPTWSLDGRFIAFDGSEPPAFRREIYVINADGLGRKKLTPSDSEDSGPEWSPDGSQFAFSSFRVDDQGNGLDEQRIWMMKADGSARTPIAPGFAPSWSSDSRRLVFVRGLGDGVRTGLFLIGSDGTGEVQLTDPRPGADRDEYPEWSPNGSYIAFTRTQFTANPPLATVWLVRPDGTGLRQLTPTLTPAYQPSWSPDGAAIVFSGSADGQLKIVRLEDEATLHLLNVRPGFTNESPEWGPER